MQMPSVAADLHQLPLRERKFARTKVALLQAALDRLKAGRRLQDIAVKELCAEVEVSEATFFNYFPRKSDLLLYHVQLWTIEAGARAAERSGLAAIETIFEFTGERMGTAPVVMLELIVTVASAQESLDFPDVGIGERLEAFPDLPGAIDAGVRTNVSSLFQQHLEDAVANGELPCDADVELAVQSLGAIFYGVPLATHCGGFDAPIAETWRSQLALLWSGLRASTGG